jgi:hypothetical protein
MTTEFIHFYLFEVEFEFHGCMYLVSDRRFQALKVLLALKVILYSGIASPSMYKD